MDLSVTFHNCLISCEQRMQPHKHNLAPYHTKQQNLCLPFGLRAEIHSGSCASVGAEIHLYCPCLLPVMLGMVPIQSSGDQGSKSQQVSGQLYTWQIHREGHDFSKLNK